MITKSRLFILFLFFQIQYLKAQEYNIALLNTLDSINNTNTPAKHFAALYYKAIEITNQHLHTQADPENNFIVKFEASFAPLFFTSYNNFVAKKEQSSFWEFYYNHKELNNLQYNFIGMNAHINGDMSLALVNAHPYDSLKKYEKKILRYQSKFNIFFDSIYNTTLQYKKVKTLHILSLGLNRNIGRKLVYKWRKRAVQMAILWYSNPTKYKRLRKRTNKKMHRFNKFAIKWLQ